LTLYEFLLFVHIAAAVVWAGGGAMIQIFGLRVLAANDPNRLAQFGGDVERIGNRALVPASLIALVSGFALVWESEFWTIGDDWIVMGLILFAITFLAGAGFFGPESGRVKKVIETEGVHAAQGRIRRLLMLTRIDLIVLFLIIFDMSVKPSFGDGWTIVGALLVAVALALAFTAPAFRARPSEAI
jgi:uncharacterized membrane protein